MIEVLNQFKTSWNYESRYKGIFAEVIAAGYKIDAANEIKVDMIQRQK